MWGDSKADQFGQDFKYSMRGMRKAPAFTVIAILTTGLAVGAATTVFSLVNGILLRPLPYPEPNRIAALWRLAPVSSTFGGEDYPWSKLEFNLLNEQTKTFQSVGAFEPDTFNLTGLGEPALLEGIRTSQGFFPALGVAPAIGRVYTAEEDRKGNEYVVVLSDRLWRDRFGANNGIVGRLIELNGFEYTVIGVMPPGFSFPHAEEMPTLLEFPRVPELWVPLAIAPGERGPNELAVIGRLRPFATFPQAQAELDLLQKTCERTFPASKEWCRTHVVPLRTQIVGDTRRPVLLVFAAVGMVLLIACSNVAGIVLTRFLARRAEFSLRSTLGAASGRIIRQVLTENFLLAAAGGALGMGFAEAVFRFVKTFGPPGLPRLQELSLDMPVFLFCLMVTLLTALLIGFMPSLAMTRDNLAGALKTGARVVGGGFSARLRSCLLVGQIALAMILVIATGLLLRSYYDLSNTDRGFKVEHVVTFEISLPPASYPDPDHMAQLYSRALQSLQSLPGVESAGLVHAVPMGGVPDATVIRVPERPPAPHEQPPYANYMFASRGYFNTTSTPLLRGRDFADTDALDSMPVTIVNRAMAEALWPGQNAVGKHVGVASTKYPLRTVIGVVANVKQSSLREDTAPQMYVPFTQNEIKVWPPMRTMQVALRTVGDPADMMITIRQAMHSVDPTLPLAKFATLTTLVQESLTQPRFAVLILSGFSALALMLASIGTYGIISQSVTQRTQEIGLRMALGAGRRAVFSSVLLSGARLAAAGIAIGVLGAYLTGRAISSYLYGVRASDPITFVTVSVVIGLVTLLACYLPARRAMQVDPVIALRSD